MGKPGRTRQEVIQLKSPISLKLDTNVGFGVQMIMQKNLGQNILFPSRNVKLKIIQCELARGRKFSGEQ